MPRERRPPKRFRTSTTDSDHESQTSGRSLSHPSSPSKRLKLIPSQTLNLSTVSVVPPKPKEQNIFVTNPFDDSPALTFARISNMNAQALGGPYNALISFQQSGQQQIYVRVDSSSLQSVMYHPNMTRQSSYPCGLCQQEVHDSDDAIMCESGCEYWCHRICTGLTEVAYAMLTKEEAAVWCCDNCIRQKKVPMIRLKAQTLS